jgi:ABC-type branched-subunit amino acid transport system substrate-binding protein
MLLACAGTLALAAGALAQDCPIKIGGLAPLSAPGTVVGGEAMRDAMLIAQDDINAAGGVLGCDIQVVIADTEGLPEKGAAVMEKLITQDGVAAVGGGYHSSVGVASKDVADARGVPVVFAETWNDTITGDTSARPITGREEARPRATAPPAAQTAGRASDVPRSTTSAFASRGRGY